MRRERFPFPRPMAIRVRARFGRKAGPARSGTRAQVGATTRRLPCLGPVLHDFAGHGVQRLESGREQFAAGDGGRFDDTDSGPWARPVLRVVWDFRHRYFGIHLSVVPGLCVPLHSPRLDHVGHVERWRGPSLAGVQNVVTPAAFRISSALELGVALLFLWQVTASGLKHRKGQAWEAPIFAGFTALLLLLGRQILLTMRPLSLPSLPALPNRILISLAVWTFGFPVVVGYCAKFFPGLLGTAVQT